MLTIDLHSLKLQELARLLESARARGEDELARLVTAELTARRGGQVPRDPSPLSARPEPLVPTPASSAPPELRRGLAIAAAVGALGLAGVWAINAPSAPPPQPASPAAAPAPQPTPEPVRLAMLTAPTRVTRVPADRPAPVGNPCLKLATPGDRLVCGYPTLGYRERQLEAALERARAAGLDTTKLEAAQAAWKRNRDAVRDRKRLADLYDARIDELEATVSRASSGEDEPS